MPVYLFVYGTLMSCFDNPMALYLRQHGEYITEGFIKGSLYDIGSYPAVILRGETEIKGEIFKLRTEGILKELDSYEGCSIEFENPHEYRREMIEVNTLQGSIQSWIYIYNWPIESYCLIETGDYRKYNSIV